MATPSKYPCDELSLECAVCMEQFQRPKLLTCMHTFCEHCLMTLTKKYEITCPTCRYVTKVEDGVSSLSVNYIIQERIAAGELEESIKKGLVFCSECEEENAVKFCTNCQLKLCDICSTYHHRISRNRNHVIRGIEEVNSFGVDNNATRTCEKHNENLKYFCATCDVALCLDCTLSAAHKSHQFSLLSEVVQEKINHLQEVIQRGNDRRQEVEITLTNANTIIKEADTLKTNSVKIIEDCFDSFIATLQKKKGELLSWLESGSKENITSVTDARRELTVLKSSIDYASELIGVKDRADIVTSILDIDKKIEGFVAADRPTMRDTSTDGFGRPPPGLFGGTSPGGFGAPSPGGLFGTSTSGPNNTPHSYNINNPFKVIVKKRGIVKVDELSQRIIEQINNIGVVNRCVSTHVNICGTQQHSNVPFGRQQHSNNRTGYRQRQRQQHNSFPLSCVETIYQ